MSTNGKHDHSKMYWKIWSILIVLTIVTVVTSYFDFGTMNIVVAMLIASVKASLVALFFMHLRYDSKVDSVVFVSSILFLLIFVGLTASDMLDRGVVTPMKIAASSNTQDMGDVAKLAKPSPELLTQGKTLYATNCVSCHGTNGKGDGPAAAAFTPKPRNFTSENWTNGGKPTQIFATLSTGFGSMPSFASLSAKDRWALVHYVRSFAPQDHRPEDAASDIAALAAKAASTTPTIPIRIALDRMAVPLAAPSFAFKKAIAKNAADSEAGLIYQNRCASCHGADGQGGANVRPYLITRSFTGSTAAWVNNASEFIRLNTAGLPGYGKPGVADLTPSEWQALYAYVRHLAGH